MRSARRLILEEDGSPDPFLELMDAGPAGVHGCLGASDARGADPQDAGPLLAAVEPAEAVDPFVAVIRGRWRGQAAAGEIGNPGDHPVR